MTKWPRSARRLSAPAFALALSSCGGGGGGSTPTPTPPQQNRAPSFTSPATALVPENNITTFYTASASDPDNDALTFTLAGGADRALFRITPTGNLAFVDPADFENPADADRNNVYLVQIGVSDGRTSAVLDLAVTVQNSGTDAFRVVRVASGFNQPLQLVAAPGRPNRVYIVEKGGRVRMLDELTGQVQATPFLDISGSISTDGEGGLLGLAFDPGFHTNGLVYVYVTNLAGDIEIRRYTSPLREVADPASGDVILIISHLGFDNHNGGWLDFGTDGLYLGTGDGGGAGDPNNNAQNPNSLLGKILRLDPSRDDFPADPNRDYAIPAGNPFAQAGGRPEVLALGLRNPFRASFDPSTRNLYIGDVGQSVIEEINLLRPADAGANFGWPFKEGTRDFRGGGPASLVPPIAEYATGALGRSVTGGFVYRGPVEALRGQYIFGDFVSGNIWSLLASRFQSGATIPSSDFLLRRSDFSPSQGAITNISSFGVGTLSNLYIVDFDGEIFRIEAQ